MKKHFICIVGIGCLLGISLTATAFADENIEQQLTSLRQQMEQMQQQMKILEKELGTAQQSASEARHHARQASEDMQQQMDEVAGRFKSLDDLASKFGHLRLSGYVRSRWWDGKGQQSTFDVTEIAFHLRYDVSENISGEFHIWWHPSGNAQGRAEFGNYSNWAGPTAFFESAFAEFRNVNIGPVNGKLLVGKARNFAFGIVPGGTYAGRVTSDYSLFHETVNISRITGIQYLASYQNFQWNFAIFNGWAYAGDGSRFGARPGQTRMLRVGQKNLDDTSRKAYSTRFAYTFQRNEYLDKLEIGASYLHQKLSRNDMNNINRIMGRTAELNPKYIRPHSFSRTDQKIGLDLAYDKGPFMFKAEYLRGRTAGIRGHYWYVMPGFCLSKVSNIKADFFVRYSQARYSQSRIADIRASGAWDKSQWTPAMVYHLHPRAKLYFEYYFNKTNNPSGTREPKTDYGFVELILFY